jgi:hypothetical protein
MGGLSFRAQHVAAWPAKPIIAGRWNCVLYSARVAILSAFLASLTFVLIQHEGWACYTALLDRLPQRRVVCRYEDVSC